MGRHLNVTVRLEHINLVALEIQLEIHAYQIHVQIEEFVPNIS